MSEAILVRGISKNGVRTATAQENVVATLFMLNRDTGKPTKRTGSIRY
jgi:hypothetical protein